MQASFHTKAIMTQYTEHLWQSSIRNEYLLDGYNTFPTQKCAKLPLTKGTSRESEVLVMSMFYDNNVLKLCLTVDESHITLLNASRSPSFISSVLSALENTAVPLRKRPKGVIGSQSDLAIKYAN